MPQSIGKIVRVGAFFCERLNQGRFGKFGFWVLEFMLTRQKKIIKIHCLQGANPALPQGVGPFRGNSCDFFQRMFEVFVPDFCQKQTFMSRTLKLFSENTPTENLETEKPVAKKTCD